MYGRQPLDPTPTTLPQALALFANDNPSIWRKGKPRKKADKERAARYTRIQTSSSNDSDPDYDDRAERKEVASEEEDEDEANSSFEASLAKQKQKFSKKKSKGAGKSAVRPGSSALPVQRKPPPARKASAKAPAKLTQSQIIARNKVLATKPKVAAKRAPATSHSSARHRW